MNDKMPICAAIVVLYNPCEEVIENIKSYNDIYDIVICIDNSSEDKRDVYEIENILYIPFKSNKGLAYALNYGCNKAISNGAKIITTFDQDTVPTKQAVKKLIECVNNNREMIIAAPRIKYIYRDKPSGKRVFSEEIVPCDEKPIWVITSGSTFSKDTYRKIGGFDDKLFISQVDQDFCYRLYNKGGHIKIIQDAYIFQEPGKTVKKNILVKEIHIPNLSAFRYFYIFRNEKYLRTKWGSSYKAYKVKLYKYLISIAFFEKDKFIKLYNCVKGYIKGRKMCAIPAFNMRKNSSYYP